MLCMNPDEGFKDLHVQLHLQEPAETVQGRRLKETDLLQHIKVCD